MIKQIKRLLVILILLTAVAWAPLAQAEGGLVFQPYWTFRTDAPVTHVQTGDINGDGVQEVIILTANSVVHVLESGGTLAWRYETGSEALDLLVDDLDGDGHTAEIWVGGVNQEILLSDVEKPVWTITYAYLTSPPISGLAVDLDGDGRRKILIGSGIGIGYVVRSEAKTYSHGDYRFANFVPGLPSVDLWAGDVDGDGRPEIVPSPADGSNVYVFEASGRRAWQKRIEGEVGLVQGGDVDGDGQAEVVVLSTSWDLFLLESDGRQIWHNQAISAGNVAGKPVPGQLIVHDLDGDGLTEIVVVTPAPAAAVHVFKEDGNQVWQRTFDAISTAARLTADDINGDGQAEVVVTTVGQDQVYLLAADGQRLAEYRTAGTTGALAYADLNDDGWGEVIVGTETGVQVFGTSHQVVRRRLWVSPRPLGSVSALYLADLDGDDQGEVVVGSNEGQVYVLADDGHVLWEVDFEDHITALSSGDVDGDDQHEVIVGTFGARGQLHLLEGNRPIWAVPVQGLISSLAVCDLDDDGRSEIIAGLSFSLGTVLLLDGEGNLTWQQKLAARVTAVDNDGGQILAGTESGRVYRLTNDGLSAGEYDLGARVLGFGQGLVVTADGQIYQLDDGEPTVVRELGGAPRKVEFGRGITVMLEEGQASLVTDDGSIWQAALDSQAISIAAGDLDGDGVAEVAVGTDQGRIHLFGLTLDQPPMLTKPDLAETRIGYAYSIGVNDPEGDAVPVTLEIWDPSASIWLTQPAQSLAQGQDQGWLSWDVPEPFDTWDSGQESRFRFRYHDGLMERTTNEIPGPLTIPTTPWYIHYGQWVGLGALILLIPVLGLLLYRRQRAYRRSPTGQAEALLKELRTRPDETLARLYDLAHDNSALLTYLPDQAREAGETTIADLSEGLHLILIRPEVTGEDLRTVRAAIEGLDGPPAEQRTAVINLYELLTQALEANTVTRIVALQPRLSGIDESLVQSGPISIEAVDALAGLGHVARTLHNYQRVEAIEDKTAYLGQALESLGRLEREFQARLPQPERNILTRLAANWLVVANNALQDLQGRAQIEVSLKTRQLLTLDQATLSVQLTNSGRSPASNLSVTLLTDQEYAVSNGTAHLDILPAGRSTLVELPVSAAPSVDQFRAEFTITFDDRERNGKTMAFADLVRVLQPMAEFRPISNPYAPGTPLRPGSPIFFGRDDLFQFIAENIAGLAQQNILVLIGQRRTGKTSFLQQLPARLGEDYLPVYLDGQSLGIDPGMANFFYDLALAIVDALADQGLEVAEPEPAEFEERPSRTFERIFLPTVFEAVGQRQLLLLFDEFEELEMRVASGKLESTIFPFFRHLMQHSHKLGFIFVGTHRLEALSSDYWSIFFNIALYKHVAFLDEAAARALIVEPVAGYGLLYDDLALDKMLRVTAGHPYFLQLTCHALVNRANREERGYLTIQDVNDVLGEMVELGEAHFAFLWERSSPAEQLVLASLTRLLGQEPTVTAAQVAELLAERGVAIELREVTEALRGLVERDIVREVGDQPPRYEYKVELVRLWIERYKALGRVVEEVG